MAGMSAWVIMRERLALLEQRVASLERWRDEVERVDAAIDGSLSWRVASDRPCILSGNVVVPLSVVEWRVVRILSSTPGRVVGPEIVASVLGGQAEREPASAAARGHVRTVMSRLRDRLREHRLEDIIETVRGVGYVARDIPRTEAA